jgi:hypothetical protein
MRGKRIALALGAVAALSLGPLASGAAAHEHEGGEPPRHAHVKLIGVVFDDGGVPVDARKCISLANGRALPLNAHHAHLHTGRAGEAQFQAGHLVVPLAPYSPFTGCADVLAFLRSGGAH